MISNFLTMHAVDLGKVLHCMIHEFHTDFLLYYERIA